MPSRDKKFAQFISPVMWWGIVIVGLLAIFLAFQGMDLPAPISFNRDGKVDEYSWQTLIMSVAINIAALWIAITTKLGERKPNDIGYILRKYAKITGWMIGIGGWFGTLHLLAILMGWMKPP
jgi:hypothetical protein